MAAQRFPIILVVLSVLLGCGPSTPEQTRITARVTPPTKSLGSGEHQLGLGGLRFINGEVRWRDGIIYVPETATTADAVPLLIWLHGGNGRAQSFRYLFPIAEETGVVMLVLDARHNTWDGIDSPFGPDVRFIDTALKHTINRLNIDPDRVAIGGLSDGGTYAVALGRANGDVFTHLIAVAAGYREPPSDVVGAPRIFVGHGTRDQWYNVNIVREHIVEGLREAGYDVTYLEFDGPHNIPKPVAREALKWLIQ